LAVLSALGLVIRKTIGMASAAFAKWLESKSAEAESNAHYAAAKCLNTRLAEMSTNAVSEVEQTLVRRFKKMEKWDAVAARDARDAAIQSMKDQAGKAGMDEMMKCSGLARDALVGLFRTWVERRVNEAGTDRASTLEAPLVAADGVAEDVD